VSIGDANDEIPACPGVPVVYVDGLATIGTPVFTLVVSDDDIGDNARIVYNSVADGTANEASLFEIDSTTGEIVTIA